MRGTKLDTAAARRLAPPDKARNRIASILSDVGTPIEALEAEPRRIGTLC